MTATLSGKRLAAESDSVISVAALDGIGAANMRELRTKPGTLTAECAVWQGRLQTLFFIARMLPSVALEESIQRPRSVHERLKKANEAAGLRFIDGRIGALMKSFDYYAQGLAQRMPAELRTPAALAEARAKNLPNIAHILEESFALNGQ